MNTVIHKTNWQNYIAQAGQKNVSAKGKLEEMNDARWEKGHSGMQVCMYTRELGA